jgi:hypothetical protein
VALSPVQLDYKYIHNRCGSIVNRGGNTLKLFSGRLFYILFFFFVFFRGGRVLLGASL